jgi:hypothetical protein
MGDAIEQQFSQVQEREKDHQENHGEGLTPLKLVATGLYPDMSDIYWVIHHRRMFKKHSTGSTV